MSDTVFLLARTAQNTYGLKNGDYSRYRRYCSGKVRKLRKLLAIKFGNKKKFVRKDVAKERPDSPKMLQILLFNAEWCWAAANESKFSEERKASQKSRGKFFTIKRLKKAVQWSEKLRMQCRERTDAVTRLESEAYHLDLQGQLQFERHCWVEAQSALLACREILADLARTSDSLSQRVLLDRVDQIEQTVKFCNFKSSKGKELTIAEIIELKRDTGLAAVIEDLTEHRLTAVSLSGEDVRFGEERYPIKQAAIGKQKEQLDEELARVREVKIRWEGSGNEQLYEGLLLFYSGAVVAAEEGARLADREKDTPEYTQGETEILKKISLLFQ